MATRRPEKIEILQLPKSVIGRVIGKVGSFVFFLPWEGIFDGCPGRQEPRSKTFVSVQDAAVAFKSFNCIFGWGLLSSFFAVKFCRQKVSARAAGARIDARDQTEDPVQDGKEIIEILQLSEFKFVPIFQGTFQVSGKVLIQGWTSQLLPIAHASCEFSRFSWAGHLKPVRMPRQVLLLSQIPMLQKC